MQQKNHKITNLINLFLFKILCYIFINVVIVIVISNS